jgi:lipoate-protein ligase A
VDEITQFLSIDTEIPNRITRQSAVNWFSKLNDFDRDKVVMISHHVDRLIQVYDILRKKLQGLQNIWAQRFGGSTPKDWDAIVGSDWLLTEFKDDVKILTNCKKLVELLGR